MWSIIVGMHRSFWSYRFTTTRLPLGYFIFIQIILQCICKNCSRLLLTQNKRREYQLKLARFKSSYLERKALHAAITIACKKQHTCPYCKAYNGTVKKTGLYKILHQPRPPVTNGKFVKPALPKEYENAVDNNQELEELLMSNSFEILSPIKVQSFFERIPNFYIPFLLIANQRPENLILNRVPVPPACIRPSIVNDDTSNEDDLTILLSEINHLTGVLDKRKREGALFLLMLESWDFIQLVMALFINSETSAIPIQMRQKKPTRGLVQRLKGKRGRFRGNLSGKSVDYSSRSVISPNPMLAIDEVRVPRHVAKALTYPERVTPHNIELMRKLVGNDYSVHPGANFVESGGRKSFLKFANRDSHRIESR